MILRLLRLILEIIRVIVNRGAPPKPGPLTINGPKREENKMLIYDLTFPAATASDVDSQEVSLKIGDADPVVTTYPKEATVSNEFAADDNTLVEGDYVQIDDAGNRSEPRHFSFTATDTVAPGQPGELGVNFKREE